MQPKQYLFNVFLAQDTSVLLNVQLADGANILRFHNPLSPGPNIDRLVLRTSTGACECRTVSSCSRQARSIGRKRLVSRHQTHFFKPAVQFNTTVMSVLSLPTCRVGRWSVQRDPQETLTYTYGPRFSERTWRWDYYLSRSGNFRGGPGRRSDRKNH